MLNTEFLSMDGSRLDSLLASPDVVAACALSGDSSSWCRIGVVAAAAAV